MHGGRACPTVAGHQKNIARFSGRKSFCRRHSLLLKFWGKSHGQASLTALPLGKAHEIWWLLLLGFCFWLPARTVSGPCLFVSGNVAGVAERGDACRSIGAYGDDGNGCVGYRHTAPQLAAA